jgi:hypothetical protein
MPLDVVALKTVAKTCNEDVIAKLEEALERARAGEIVAIAIAAVLDDGGIAGAWSKCNPCGPLIGAVACLQHNLVGLGDDKGGDSAA